MGRRFIQKDSYLLRKLSHFIVVGVLLGFILPVFVSASGSYPPISIYEPYRIKRNMEYIFLDNPKDYYSYFLGDKLDPVTFYMAYRYFQDKSLFKSQISDIEKIFKSNGNYLGGSDPSPFESDKAFEAWKKERNAVMNDNYAYGQEFNSDNYYYSDNNILLSSPICPFGTFENAANLLRDKKKTLSVDVLKTWINNQDKIFLNCFESWSQWRDRAWGNNQQKITCDDQKLQGLQPLEEGKGFWLWLKSFFRFGKKKQEVVLPISDSYVMPFRSRGLVELQQDEEMQNALYYYYKAKKEYLCSNIAGELFKKISENIEHPYHANATLGYIRTLIRDSRKDEEATRDVLEKINQYLADKSLEVVRDSLLVEKEKILSSLYDEAEFIKSQKGLENPSPNFIHDAAIFRQQYKLFVENNKSGPADERELDKHSELVRFLYYWNFEKPDNQWFSRIEKEYEKSSLKNIWLTLLLRNGDLIKQKYIDIGINTVQNSKLHEPVLYYSLAALSKTDKDGASILAKKALAGSPDIAYNYFADLIMQNSSTLNEAVNFIFRKSSFLLHQDTIDYAYVRSSGKTLELLLDEAGWRNDKTGDRYYYRFVDKKIEKPIDDDLLSFINLGLPIDRLYSNPVIRERFKTKIFVRAFMLGRKDIYLPLLTELGSTNSILAQAVANKSDTTRDFIISYAILRNLNENEEDLYGVSLHNSNYNFYSNTDDWIVRCNYCDNESNYNRSGNNSEINYFIENDKTNLFNKFLTKNEIIKNLDEKKILFDESLVRIFGEPVLAYMKTNPGDGRIPEALSHLIKGMSRWHDRESDGDWTKKLFETLHYNYPNSRWTKDTPVYW